MRGRGGRGRGDFSGRGGDRGGGRGGMPMRGNILLLVMRLTIGVLKLIL